MRNIKALTQTRCFMHTNSYLWSVQLLAVNKSISPSCFSSPENVSSGGGELHLCGLATWGPDRIHPSCPKHSGRGSRDSCLNPRAVGKTLPGPHPWGRGTEGAGRRCLAPRGSLGTLGGGARPGSLEAWKPKKGLFQRNLQPSALQDCPDDL